MNSKAAIMNRWLNYVPAAGLLILTACMHPEKRVLPPPQLPQYTFTIEPRELAPGESAMLRWNIPGATTIVIEQAGFTNPQDLQRIGTFAASGELRVTPEADTTYVLSCEGGSNLTCASVSIRVRVKPP